MKRLSRHTAINSTRNTGGRSELHRAGRIATVRRRRWPWIAITVLTVGLIGYGLWSAAPTSGESAATAPDFTLPTTAPTELLTEATSRLS